MLYVLRIRPGDQIAEPRAYDLIRGLITVKSRHHVVAFGEVRVFVGQFDMLVCRCANRDRLFKFEAPDPFRSSRDEGAVTLLALPQTFHRPGPLNRLPASI